MTQSRIVVLSKILFAKTLKRRTWKQVKVKQNLLLLWHLLCKSQIKYNAQKFEKKILEGPTHKCHSCETLFFGRLGAKYSWDVANELLTIVNEAVEARGEVPAGLQFNKMKVADTPPELIGLNTLEQCLISKATVFMKMVILPRGGQRAIQGQVINFPSNVDSVISQLPRLPNGEDSDFIQQAVSTKCNSNGNDQETPYHSCRYSKVMQPLQWLKQHNPFYRDVTITNVREDMFDRVVSDNLVNESQSTDSQEHQDIEMDETGLVRLDALQPNVVDVELLQENKSI